MTLEISFRDAYFSSPDARSTPLYLPTPKSSESLRASIREFAGPSLVCAFRYGSSVAGDHSRNSRMDWILVVDDVVAFHIDQAERRFVRGEDPYDVLLHATLSKTPSYYYSQLNPDGGAQKTRIKYLVIQEDDFLAQAGGLLVRNNPGDMYLAGRFQKALIEPVITSPDVSRQKEIDAAIQEARIAGLWMACARIPGSDFSYEQMADKYVTLSYASEFRPRIFEKKNKPQLLLDQGSQDYAQMLDPLLAEFVRLGVLESIDEEHFRKILTLKPGEVNKKVGLYKRASIAQVVKNGLTVGVQNAPQYLLEKMVRSIRSRFSH